MGISPRDDESFLRLAAESKKRRKWHWYEHVFAIFLACIYLPLLLIYLLYCWILNKDFL